MSRLKLHFDFGWHSTRSDAAGLDGRLRTFRPFVLVSEDTTLSREKRLAQILGTNLCIDAARKGKPGERALIEEVYSGSGDFNSIQMNYYFETGRYCFFLRIMEKNGK